jgi:hypothetical protein
MSFQEVKRLPLRAFWMLQKNIDRLEAAQDYRTMQVMLSVTSEQGVKAHTERLKKIIGKVIVYDEARMVKRTILEEDRLDVDGLNRLRGKGRLR